MSNITDKIMICLFVVIAVCIVVFLAKDELARLFHFIGKRDRKPERNDDTDEEEKKSVKRWSPFKDEMKTWSSRGPEIEIFIKETGEKIHHTMTEKEISIGGRNAKNVTIKIDSPYVSHKHLIIRNLFDEDGPFTRITNCSKHGVTEHKVMVNGKKHWVYVKPNENVDVDEGEEEFWLGDAARVKVSVPKFAHHDFDIKTHVAGDERDCEEVRWREQYCSKAETPENDEKPGEEPTVEKRPRKSFKDEWDYLELNPEKNPFDYL